MLKRNQLIFLIAFTYFLIGCASPPTSVPQPFTVDLYQASKNSVDVTVMLEKDAAGQASLVATFTPADPALHLYAKEFPRAGIDGVGRPTLLEIVSGPAQPAGELQASAIAEKHDISGFDEPFSLYPDGPVTLTQPVTLPETRPAFIELQLSITYMACSSDGGCKLPVTDNQFTVILPDTVWSN